MVFNKICVCVELKGNGILSDHPLSLTVYVYIS